MSNIIDSVLGYFNPRAALSRALARRSLNMLEVKAGYDASGKGRRWVRAAGTNQNAEMRRSLTAMRNVSRELQRNNPYAAAALQAVVSGTVGGGIKPVAVHPAKNRNGERKKALANSLMSDWAGSTFCDYDGRLNLFGLQSLCMQTESLSGEGLLVRRFSKDRRLAIPLKLQLLEGDFLDHTKDGFVNNSKALIQGVILEDGERKGYYLYDSHPSEITGRSVISREVSADQVAHIYDMIRPGQVRGAPRGVAAFTRLKVLDDYQDARVEQMRMAACLSAFIFNEESEGKGDILPDALEPGGIYKLNGGENIVFNTPPSTADHSSFIVPEQRVIATAWGITYEALTGDYSKVNFASGKMGRIQMYSNVHRWRYHMMIPLFCKNVERWFLEAAAIAGYDLSGITFDWTPPKKEILDPAAEIPAIIKEVRSGLNSFQGACRERGIDPELLLSQIKEDCDLFDKYGLVLDIDARRTTQSGQMQTAINSGEGVDLTTNDEGLPGEDI